MSVNDYTTIARTPLQQLHSIPSAALSAYLAQCCSITRHAILRAISASTGA